MKLSNKRKSVKKKTRQGQSNNTKRGTPGPSGGNKQYKKRYRGQGKQGLLSGRNQLVYKFLVGKTIKKVM